MPASEDFRLIKVPSLSGLSELRLVSLRGHGLLEFPRSLLELPQLRCVDLSENRLTTVPPDITRMTRLADLDLSQNALRMVDGETSEFSEVLPALFAMRWMNRIVLQKNCIGAGWQKKLLEDGAKAHVSVLVAGCFEPPVEPVP
jgi:Leucine-rich repeat (LRR) protein